MGTKGLPGFRDFYPDDTALRNHIFAAWRQVAARYGFVEYDGPPLEPLELYTQKSGEEIVGQLYAFEDRGGRSVALRPEMTPTLARLVAAKAVALKKPIRWYSIPQLFRYERQQRGRLREHYQLNMDLIGESGPLADAELIAAAIDVMRMFDLPPSAVRARVSDRSLIQALLLAAGVQETQVALVYQQIDKIGRDPHDVLVHRLGASGVDADLAEKALMLGAVRGRTELEKAMRDVGVDEGAGRPLLQCTDALEAMGLGAYVDIDLSIVRGLAYYTGTVFELFDAAGSLRAICGGGRYDDLLGTLGGVDMPAAGFGMGDVVLGELIRDRFRAPSSSIDLFVVAVGGGDSPTALEIVHQLRDAGKSVEFSLKEQSVAKQLKLAAARGAQRAVIIGPAERERHTAIVRDLSSGVETEIPFAALTTLAVTSQGSGTRNDNEGHGKR